MTLPSDRAPGRQQPGVGVFLVVCPIRAQQTIGRSMNKSSSGFGIARRLYAVSAAVSLALAALAAYAWISLHQAADLADFTEKNRVPQLNAMAELELNVTQTSLQLRHAMLARNPQELQATLQSIGEKRKHMDEVLGAFEKRLFSPQGKAHFDKLPPVIADFWKAGEANIALIQEGKKDEAFAYLVDVTIPKRNALLVVLHEGAEIQSQGLQADIGRVESQVLTASNLVVAAAGVIAALMVVFSVWVAGQLRRRVTMAQSVAEQVRDGDLTASVHDTARDEFSPLLAALRDMQSALGRVVNSVREGAEGVATASAQIAQGNQDLSHRTEQQASALEETSASMEEMGSTASQNADNARAASQLAMNASSVAKQGGEVVSQVVSTMREIQHSSQKINDIIGVIDGIAFQTNILALNAAVEAARAGEQGRGFAVVAGEVRTLAQRSAEAAKEIKQLINASVERVEQGTTLVDQAGHTMEEVVQSIQRVTDIVGEISSASQEQNAGVRQVSEAVSNMDQTTQQNAALVEESASAAASLRQQADQLLNAVSVFRTASSAPVAAVSQLVATPVARAVPMAAKPLPRPAPAKALPKPAAAARAPAPVGAAPKASPKAVPVSAGASDDWESF
jgi:methyl-accepting chemotaxis protein